ncbi:MAG: sigma-70 family RNA polymerase sigma factor [bacterium]|nr:sigma-70 family RNA polymerase sigma factor [bacterium]
MQAKIQDYIELIEKVAKVEQRRIPSHMVEYEELVSIGIIAIQTMIKGKTEQQLARYNNAYISTAVRWAIRNELRNRYKWYSLKNTKEVESSEDGESGIESSGEDEKISPHKVREAIYTTILSIDSLQQANGDNESPFDFIRDTSALPDERAEISELGKVIREAIATLPQKDRTIVEYRFYRNMQVKEIAAQVGLSSSRITRIVQSALNYVREYLQKREHYGY